MSEFYEFVSADTSSLIAEKIKEYEGLTGRAVNAADPDRLFLVWAINALLIERQLLNYTGNQNIPSRASGENLDALAELFYTHERPKARPAECTIRFYITVTRSARILIPAGTRVTDGGQTLYWETLEDIYVEPGNLYADGKVICQTTGAVGNGWGAGTIDTVVDLYSYVDRCENTTESALGADDADDEEFYELLRSSMDAFSTAGPSGAYEYHAKAVSSDIADVKAVQPKIDGEGNPIDGAGLVELYVLMADGTPADATVKEAVLEACNAEDVRPLTDSVSMKDPEAATYNINVTFYIPRPSSQMGAQIVEKVTAAVNEYIRWQQEKLGRDINPSKLYELLMATGVKRITVSSPSFTVLRDGSNGLPPQYAALGTVTVTNGGVEDE